MNGAERRKERVVQRRQLEAELKICEEQIQALEQRLTELGSTLPSISARTTGKAAGQQGVVSKAPPKGRAPPKKAAGQKRPAAAAFEPAGGLSVEAKRQKIEADRQRRVGNLFNQCFTMLKTLKKHRDGQPFLNPVDPVANGVPDYFTIVKKPMDFTTVSKKLAEKGNVRIYVSPLEFRDDIRQIFTNCRLYNREGLPVRLMGDALSDAFEKKWEQSGIEKKWEEEMQKQKIEDEELSGRSASLPNRLKQMEQVLRTLHDQAEAHTQKQPPPPEGGSRPMSFEEKRRLSINLASLPPDKMDPVIEILSEQIPTENGEEEMEFDIDMLSDHTLWRLERYVNKVLLAATKKVESAAKGNKNAEPSRRVADGEQTSRPPSAADGAPAPPKADRMRPEAAQPAALRSTHSSSSGSSSGSGDSSSQGRDSEGEVGSKEHEGSTFNDERKKGNSAVVADGHDMSTLVSATRPHHQQLGILRPTKAKDATLQNAALWANLKDEAAPPDEAQGNGTEAGPQDELWQDFKSREQQQVQREQEKREQEERQRQEKERAEEERRRAAEEEAARHRAAEEARVEEQRQAVEAQKAAELARLQQMERKTGEFGQQDVMASFQRQLGGHAVGLDAFGLSRKADDDEEEDFDDDEGEGVGAEDGEL